MPKQVGGAKEAAVRGCGTYDEGWGGYTAGDAEGQWSGVVELEEGGRRV